MRRYQSTGQRGRIHLSQECAELIMAAQKAHWVQPREDKVTAKGKGELTTFWLGETGPSSSSSVTSSNFAPSSISTGANIVGKDSAAAPLPKILRKRKPEKPVVSEAASKTARLVDWNVDILQRLLKQIEARRSASVEKKKEESRHEDPAMKQIGASGNTEYARKSFGNATDKYQEPREAPHCEDTKRIYTDEVKEVITLPKFDSRAARKADNAESVVLSYDVMDQLHDFVKTISALYRENRYVLEFPDLLLIVCFTMFLMRRSLISQYIPAFTILSMPVT